MDRGWSTVDSFVALLLVFLATLTAVESQPIKCNAEVDLCFLIDGSSSICDTDPKFNYNRDTTCDNWAFVVKFVYDFVSQVYIGPDGMRVAAIMFGDSAQLKWDLTRYPNRIGLLQAINTSFAYMKGQVTNTVAALNLMASVVFNTTDRPSAVKTAIIITDGRPTDPNDVNSTVAKIHEQGISTYVIGVTSQIVESMLQLLSSPPHLMNVTYFVASSFNIVDTIRTQLLDQTCYRLTSTTPSTTTAMTTTTSTTTTSTAAAVLEIGLGIGVPSAFIILVFVIIIIVLCIENRSLRKYKRRTQDQQRSQDKMQSHTVAADAIIQPAFPGYQHLNKQNPIREYERVDHYDSISTTGTENAGYYETHLN